METVTRSGSFVLMLILVTSVEGQLYLIPSDTILRFVNSSVTFHCYHRNDRIRDSVWLINGTYIFNSTLNQSFTVSEIPGASNLIIDILIPEFNNTKVNCNASSSTGIMESSQDSDIKLQGILSKVNDLRISVNGSYLILVWNPPFAIIDDITYIIAERRTNYTLSNYVTSQLYHNAGLITSFESDCTDYSFDITPENSLGLGQNATISIIREDIIMGNYSRQKRNQDHNFDLSVELTTVICTARIQWKVFNSNFNYMVLNEFTLNAVSQNYYKYLFNLNLPSGFYFHLNLNLNNSRDHYQQSIMISTFSTRDVEIDILEPGLLNLKPMYYDDSNEMRQSFIMLLLCSNKDCHDIDFDNSIYIVIKTEECEVSFLSGFYQMYAFDVNEQGAIHPSSMSMAYPAYSDRKILTFSGSNSLTSNPAICSIIYDNGMICSLCTSNNTEESSLQQIVLLPKSYNNVFIDSITISEPAKLSVRACLRNKSDDYYALIILVTQSDNIVTKYPIARKILSSIPINEIYGTTTMAYFTTDTSPNIPINIQISIIFAALTVLLFLAATFLLSFFVLRICKGRIYKGHIYKGHNESKHSTKKDEIGVSYRKAPEIMDEIGVSYRKAPEIIDLR